jgi:HK97 family phage major capsid protein
MNGTGVSAMLGIQNAPCLIVAAKDGGQTASTVTYTNLTNMISRLLGTSWRNAAWFVNQTVLPQLFGVYLAVGSSGGLPAPLTQAPDGSYRLFGLPLIVTELAPVLSSQGDVGLYDMSRFVAGVREDLRVEVSRDFLFDSDQVAFRVVQRRDGMPVDDKAITPAQGATTIGGFIALQAR